MTIKLVTFEPPWLNCDCLKNWWSWTSLEYFTLHCRDRNRWASIGCSTDREEKTLHFVQYYTSLLKQKYTYNHLYAFPQTIHACRRTRNENNLCRERNSMSRGEERIKDKVSSNPNTNRSNVLMVSAETRALVTHSKSKTKRGWC